MRKKELIKIALLKADFDKNDFVEIHEIARGLSDCRSLIGCDAITIIERRIGDKIYNIIYNDKTTNPDPSCVNPSPESDEVLYGNVIVCGDMSPSGDLKGLTDDDISNIHNNITSCVTLTDEGIVKYTLLVINNKGE